MRILAVLPKGGASRAILKHLGLPTAPPEPSTLDPPRHPEPELLTPEN